MTPYNLSHSGIGIYMSRTVLEHKLSFRTDQKNTEVSWNCKQIPEGGLSKKNNKLSVAVDGYWRGFFTLKDDFLWNPSDKSGPFTLLFDSKTWKEIYPIPCRPFRGISIDIPRHIKIKKTRVRYNH